MIYFYVFIIGFLGALSGNFSKLGERNIGNAGGPNSILLPQLFAPALVISFLLGFTPYIAILLVGISIGWLEALYALGTTLIAAFVCGFLPFKVRHIIVCISPIVIGWALYQIWIY